jgi:ABC-type lipoprotein export system ATPase subunit
MSVKLHARDFLYFYDKSFQKESSNLKLFIKFLKLSGQKTPIKFNYIGHDCTLLSSLTIEENIILSVGNNISDIKKPGYLDEHIKRINNPFLVVLYNDLKSSCHLDMMPVQVSLSTHKKAALIKTLLQTGKFLIIEDPEINIDNFIIKTFQKAVQFEVNNKDKIVLLKTKELECWSQYVTKYISINNIKKLEIVTSQKPQLQYRKMTQRPVTPQHNNLILLPKVDESVSNNTILKEQVNKSKKSAA